MFYITLIIACIVITGSPTNIHRPGCKTGARYEGGIWIRWDLTPATSWENVNLRRMETLSTVSSKGENVVFTVTHNLWLPMLALVQITKEDVDNFETGQAIPSCHLTAVWTKQGEQPSHLRQKVTLVGATATNNYFNIVLDSTRPDTTGGELLA